jgi:GH15 family glucan-1,4-alpha-glucosidase
MNPLDGGYLGNFPQAFSHIGLINATLSLDACENRKERAA